MKTPSPDDLYIAALWLENYEGVEEGAEDAEACHRVSAWLEKQAAAAEFRAACRDCDVPVSVARKQLKKQGKL